MIKTFLESVLYGMNDDGGGKDSPEVIFYWDKLFAFVEEHADPKYDKNSISNALYDIAAPLCSAERLQGFKMGATFALKFAAECFTVSDRTAVEAADDYKKWYRTPEPATPEDAGKGGDTV